MVPGRSDREWIPATFSSYVLPGTHLRAVGVRADGVGEAIGLAIFSDFDRGPGVYVPSLEDATLSWRAALARPFDDLAGAPISARSRHRSGLALLRGSVRVHGRRRRPRPRPLSAQLRSMGAEVLWRDRGARVPGAPTRGSTVSTAPQAADVDGDGHLDVLVGAPRYLRRARRWRDARRRGVANRAALGDEER